MVEAEADYYIDANGVPVLKKKTPTAEESYSEEEVRVMKQTYLHENVIQRGYDATEFAQFMEYKKGKQTKYIHPSIHPLIRRQRVSLPNLC